MRRLAAGASRCCRLPYLLPLDPALSPDEPEAAPPLAPGEAAPVEPALLSDEPEDVPPAEELPALSEDAAGGQSLLAAEDELPALLLVLGEEADALAGGQFAALEPEAPLAGELLELLAGALLSDEPVLGELAPGELEYEPLDCAIAPAESASSALAVAAAINLNFIVRTPFRNFTGNARLGARNRDDSRRS